MGWPVLSGIVVVAGPQYGLPLGAASRISAGALTGGNVRSWVCARPAAGNNGPATRRESLDIRILSPMFGSATCAGQRSPLKAD